MSSLTLGLVLAFVSALTTSIAHALLKSGGDKLAVQAWMKLTGIAIFLPIAMWLGPPPAQLWPWIIAGAAIHAIYQVVLIYSYSVSDFSVAYPIARGISPIFTALLGILFLDDSLGALALFGIAVVSVGIVSVARGKSIKPLGFAAAVVTGLLTTAYSLVDAKGVRLAPSALTFIAWFYLADAISMPLILLYREKGNTVVALAPEVRTGIFAGIMTFFSFVPALLAFRLAPAGTVAAIRETSVIIGLALSAAFLKEIVDARRLVGAMLVTMGTLAIIAGAH